MAEFSGLSTQWEPRKITADDGDIFAFTQDSQVVHQDLDGQEYAITCNDLGFAYDNGDKPALHHISFGVPRGKITALMGPSGCGKSTLLRCANRMNDLVDGAVHTGGEMLVDGADIHDPNIDVIELRQRMGMVFQKQNPFPKSIFENAIYALRIRGINKKSVLEEVAEKTLRAAALWDEVKDRLKQPALGLSGGQQQRLCIARALAGEPDVLLLDEPCSALDPIATGKIEDLLGELRGEYTILIVTHNMQQAKRVSDYSALMYCGHLVECGSTTEVFMNPKLDVTERFVTL